MAGRLDGKTALITGTGGGQGEAAAHLFAEEGANVVGCDLKEQESEQTTKDVREAGGEMISQEPVDLGDEDEVAEWIDFAVDEYGPFDILYNNASAPRFGKSTEMSEEDWHFTLRNELDLVFYAVKHAAPVLIDNGGGSIINIASVAGLTGSTMGDSLYEFAHSTTKGGVISMTRTMAVELGDQNIRVNSISPGMIDTPAIRSLPPETSENLKNHIETRTPMGRYGEAEDIAKVALFLASDESGYVSGENIVVDGGYTVA